jgi:hypothetical protein
MELELSAAEKRRRRLFEELTRKKLLPPRITHRELYAHAAASTFPFIGLPEDKHVPLRSAETFVQLAHRKVARRGPAR